MSRSGNPLSEYESYDNALESASYVDKNLVPYQCEKCGRYHLKPKEFYYEKSKGVCSCRAHDGSLKLSYKTYEDAQKMVNIRANAGVTLNIYKCPEGNGYHLTSHFEIRRY